MGLSAGVMLGTALDSNAYKFHVAVGKLIPVDSDIVFQAITDRITTAFQHQLLQRLQDD